MRRRSNFLVSTQLSTSLEDRADGLVRVSQHPARNPALDFGQPYSVALLRFIALGGPRRGELRVVARAVQASIFLAHVVR
jgi:hypothetical protein